MGVRKFERPVHMISRAGQVAKLTLADGFRFMILVKGEPPTLVPIFEQGTYHIDIPENLAKDNWPVGVMTVDASQVPAMLKIKPDVVTRMLNAAADHMKGGAHD